MIPLEDYTLKSETGEYYFSVIIPTYRDTFRLNLCLDKLMAQTFPLDRFEVIVVNNDPSDKLVLNNRSPSFKLYHESKAGSYAARNKAMQVASGEILVFTDSDCLPHKDWLQKAHDQFESSKVDRIGGKVNVFPKDASSKTWVEIYEQVFAFDQKRNVEILKASVTANLFAKKHCFEKVGNFDENKKSGEDFGWNRRANEAGYSLVYSAEIVVDHPARRDYKEIASKRKRVFGGHKIFEHRSKFKKLIYPLVLFYNYYVYQHARLFRSDAIGVMDKFKVSWVIFYLLLVTEVEYIKLLLGKKPSR